MTNQYQTKAEIEKVVSDFEQCVTGKDDFHHADHLLVAVVYLERMSIEEATDKLRTALMRFLDHHSIDKQKYNETLTVFWLEMVAVEVKRLKEGVLLVEKCNSVIDALTNSKLALEFYSHELLWSESARRSFVDPDLKHWR